ncbi:uncharacterized protein [Palaemon carinicauda]|uniref:uncharacterized protein n=1 Tax=Palaemon carinicauda TaxID=392227 RepID=UPI0035B5E376
MADFTSLPTWLKKVLRRGNIEGDVVTSGQKFSFLNGDVMMSKVTGDKGSGTAKVSGNKGSRSAKVTGDKGSRTAKATRDKGSRTVKATRDKGSRTVKVTGDKGFRTSRASNEKGVVTCKETAWPPYSLTDCIDVNMPPKTSGKAAKKASKAQNNIAKGDKEKKKRRRKEGELLHPNLQAHEAGPPRHWKSL